MTPKILTFLLFIIASLAGCSDEGLETNINDESTRTAAVPIEEGTDMPLASGPYEDMLKREEGMVQAVPPIPGMQAPWSGSLNLGNSVNYAPDAHMRQTVLKLDEWGPPEVWTVSLSMEHDDWPVGDDSGLYYLDVEAEITFGSGGSDQVLRCSWNNGATISLPFNAVNVTAVYKQNVFNDIGGAAAIPPPNLKLGAMVARGSRSTNAVLLNTAVINREPGVNGFTLPIPEFATEFEVLATDSSTVASVFSVDHVFDQRTAMTVDGSFAGMTVWGALGNTLQYRKIPIIPGARCLHMGSFSAAEVIFDILWTINP